MSVFSCQRGPPGEVMRHDLAPVGAPNFDLVKQQLVLHLRPGAMVDLRVEAVVPPLPALVPVSALDMLGNPRPFCAVLFNAATQSIVFFRCPWSLAEVVGDLVVPPFAAVLVGPPREVCGYLMPVDGISLGIGCLTGKDVRNGLNSFGDTSMYGVFTPVASTVPTNLLSQHHLVFDLVRRSIFDDHSLILIVLASW